MSSLLRKTEILESSLLATPVVQLHDPQLDLYAKLEYCNPSGSLKDRPAFWILREAIRRGEITPETTVVESSSGNFAIALASFCRWLGVNFVPVIDPNVAASTEIFLRSICRRVDKVTQADGCGGFLKTRLTRVKELLAEVKTPYWPNQYANVDGIMAHYHLTGAELCLTQPQLDYLFVGVSTGGTIAGMSKRIKEFRPHAQVIAVDAEGSAIFGGPTRRRYIPGLGSSISPQLLAHATIDQVIVVSEREAVAGCNELVNRFGIFAGGSTGSVYAAIKRYFAGYQSTVRPRVAFLCADRGQPYLDTVYNINWVERHLTSEHDAEAPSVT